MKKYQHYRYIDAGGGEGGGGSFTNYTQRFWKKYCFSTLSSGSHFVQWSGTSCKILKESIINFIFLYIFYIF